MKLKLTGRDTRLLRTLDAYSLLSTKQLNDLVFPGVGFRTVLRRLRKLESAKIIQRTKEYRYGMSVWYLTGAGAHRIGSETTIRAINKNVLEHDLLVNDLRMRLSPLKFVNSWKSAHHIKHERGVEVHPLSRALDTIPDWLCSINAWNGVRNVAIEVELSYKGPRRMENVFYSYLRKKRLHHLWYFVATPTMGNAFVEILKRITRTMHNHDPKWFLWSTISEINDNPSDIKLRTLDGEIKLSELFALPAHRSAHTVGISNLPVKKRDSPNESIVLPLSASRPNGHPPLEA